MRRARVSLGLFDARAGFDRLLDLCIRTEHFNVLRPPFDVLVVVLHEVVSKAANGDGAVNVDVTGRDDALIIQVPTESIGFITGHKGEALRNVEKASGTFCFLNLAQQDGTEELLCFSKDERAREHA